MSGCVRSPQRCHASRMMINAAQALTDSETEAPGPTKVEAGQTAPPPSVKDTKKETGKKKNPAIKKRPAAQGEQTKPRHGETHGVGLSEPVPGQQWSGQDTIAQGKLDKVLKVKLTRQVRLGELTAERRSGLRLAG